MVRTKLVPKRITLAPQRNRVTENKITILPEQKSIQIKKKRSSSSNSDKKNTKVYRRLGQKLLNHARAKLGRS